MSWRLPPIFLLADSFAGGIPNAFVKTFLFRGYAIGFLENRLALWQLQVVYLLASNPGLRIRLWIIKGHGQFQRHGVGMPKALLQMHALAVWISQIIEPHSFVISGGGHHK